MPRRTEAEAALASREARPTPTPRLPIRLRSGAETSEAANGSSWPNCGGRECDTALEAHTGTTGAGMAYMRGRGWRPMKAGGIRRPERARASPASRTRIARPITVAREHAIDRRGNCDRRCSRYAMIRPCRCRQRWQYNGRHRPDYSHGVRWPGDTIDDPETPLIDESDTGTGDNRRHYG